MDNHPEEPQESPQSHARDIRFVVGENPFFALLEAAPDAMVIVDPAGSILALNQQAERLFGYRRDELLGEPLEQLLLESVRHDHVQHRHDYFADPQFRPMGSRHVLTARRKDGRAVPVEISLSPLRTADGMLVIAAIRDISARKLEPDHTAPRQEPTVKHNAVQRAMHLASFPELNPNPVLEVDLLGRITFANPATRRILEQLGLDPTNAKAFLPADLDAILDGWDEKNAFSLDREIDLGGKVFGEAITLVPQLRVARIYAFDITERKRAEEALRASEGQYRSLFDNMLEGFAYCQMLFDEQGHPIDFRYLDVNTAFETITGLKNVTGKKVTEVIPGIREQNPELFEIYGRVAASRQPERLVLFFKPLTMWLSLAVYSPAQGYLVAVFDNITEREQAETLSHALTSLNADIHSSLNLDEIMQRALGAAAQALGSDTAAISLRQGDSWFVRYVHGFPQDVIGTQMNDDQERHAVLAIQTKKPVVVEDAFNDERVNQEHMRKWGVRSVLVVPLVVKDQAIGVAFFNFQSACTFRQAHIDFATQLAASLSLALENARLFEDLEKELAYRKLAEERALRLNDDLEERAGELSVANEELERLATSLALDLRSPLVSLHGIANVITQDYGAQLPDQAQALFQLIHANAEEMEALTQGLLQLMRVARQPVRKQEFQPEELVRAVLMELQPQREAQPAEIAIGDLPACRADPLLLKQVWVHLLSNALQATRNRDHAHIEIGARPEGHRIAYFVKDNGVGFDMSYAGTIFRAFQRYHRPEEWDGSGVGLAIVESIIRRHGGRVWAESVVGEGATFFFEV